MRLSGLISAPVHDADRSFIIIRAKSLHSAGRSGLLQRCHHRRRRSAVDAAALIRLIDHLCCWHCAHHHHHHPAGRPFARRSGADNKNIVRKQELYLSAGRPNQAAFISDYLTGRDAGSRRKVDLVRLTERWRPETAVGRWTMEQRRQSAEAIRWTARSWLSSGTWWNQCRDAVTLLPTNRWVLHTWPGQSQSSAANDYCCMINVTKWLDGQYLSFNGERVELNAHSTHNISFQTRSFQAIN